MSEPQYEKLVWQGEFRGMTVRVRIIRYDDPDGSPIFTEVCRQRDGEWEGVAFWNESDADKVAVERLAFISFVEAMIDLMGRPEWDTRPRATSVYPPKLLIADANGVVMPQVGTVLP